MNSRSPKPRIVAGAMSGTSADGVDIALVEITGRGLEMSARLLHHHARVYDSALRESIFSIRNSGAVRLSDLAKLGREISLAYAAAVNDALREADLRAGDIAAIAAHGQTLFHDPPNTIQWFDPSLVAAGVGCAVVSDFRRADCAAGGQGAPLVPFADYILFRHPSKHRVLLNIGGIANLANLWSGDPIEKVVAFDTGPGNCISDYIVRTRDPAGEGFDRNGRLALAGVVDEAVVEAMVNPLRHVTKNFTRSLDVPDLLSIWRTVREARAACSWRLEDELATACRTTASCVCHAILNHVVRFPDEVVASGGGTSNQAIMKELRDGLGAAVSVIPIDELGIPSAAKEAMAFALLGAATLDGIPSNVPSVTGADRPAILGSLTPNP